MDLNLHTILTALLLTFLAGAATGVGSLIAFFTKNTSTKFLSCALGLSAGVMIYVSFVDMLPQAFSDLAVEMPGKVGKIAVVCSFFGGIGLIALIDWLIPEDENPHEMHMVEEISDVSREHRKMKRTGLMVGTAIAIHNFPEGVATFLSALDGLEVAIPIVVAIAIHNIPEGIAVSVPILRATGSRNNAFKWSLLTGLTEPAGAILAIFVLLPFWTPQLSSILLAAVAGIMVYISIDELLPSAERYGHHHPAIAGFIGGMMMMAFSMLLF